MLIQTPSPLVFALQLLIILSLGTLAFFNKDALLHAIREFGEWFRRQ